MILPFKPKPYRRDSKLYVKPAKVTPINDSPRKWLLDTIGVLAELEYRKQRLPIVLLQLDLIKVACSSRKTRRTTLIRLHQLLPAILKDLERCRR